MKNSNNWRNSIKVKHLFQSVTTPELIVTLCNSLINQLNVIQKKEEHSNLHKDEQYFVSCKIEDITSNFQVLKELSDGSIAKFEWSDYGFDGDYEKLFNNHLTELYDLADTKVKTTSDILEKFIWIE